MVKITFIAFDKTERTVDANSGQSVMEAAVKNAVPGIDADCGGACACATCHVYIDPAWTAKTGTRNDLEESMLDFAEHVQPNSRLSCQLNVTEELQGLVIHTPRNQG